MKKSGKKDLKIKARRVYKEIVKELPLSYTAYGEPQAFACVDKGRMLEVVLEQEGLSYNEQYYSCRLNCSEEEFDEDMYHGTCGAISTFCTEKSSLKQLKAIIYDAMYVNRVC